VRGGGRKLDSSEIFVTNRPANGIFITKIYSLKKIKYARPEQADDGWCGIGKKQSEEIFKWHK
jgi:hypothetical protein